MFTWKGVVVIWVLYLVHGFLMAQTFARQVADRFPLRLGTPQLKAVAALSAPENLTVTGSTLAPFLVPRVSGTEGNKNVQKHIIDTFTELGWGIEQDQFSDSTPFGVKHFNNIIVTKDPAALRKLVLAAHFDSKYFEEFEFIGATDSSVPCAILVDIAKTINELLQEKIMSGDRFATIQIIFFDGEEAFVKWTDTDSIYGSRHLAKKWSETQLLTNSDPSLHLMNSHDLSGQYYTTPIKQIDAMVLLDLLGAPKSSIPNTHPETSWIWDRLVDIQTRLAENDILSQALRDRINNPNDQGIFLPGLSTYLTPHSIQDDHVPFYSLGVPVVHCIPVPFPKEWHTEFDNSNAISADTVHDLALIFRTFVIEYLGLLLHKP